MTARRSGKSADYYLNLHYPITIRELDAEEGGGYLATIPLLGSKTFAADGETPTEAVGALDALRKHLIPMLVEKGEVLPEPQDEHTALEGFNGSLMLRIPRLLHYRLATEATRSRTSINKLATQLLAQGLGEQSAITEMHAKMEEVVEEMRHIARQTAPKLRTGTH